MNVYVSTKFSDLSQFADLISIGMVIEQVGKPLTIWYSEILNPDQSKWSDFVQNHDATTLGLGDAYLRKAINSLVQSNNSIHDYTDPDNTGNLINVICPRKSNYDILAQRFYDQIFPHLEEGETVKFVVDVGFYPMVFINGMLSHVRANGGIADPVVGSYDVNQVLADMLYNGDPALAFEASREELVNMATGCDFYKHMPRYNAFSDAFLVYLTFKIFKGAKSM